MLAFTAGNNNVIGRVESDGKVYTGQWGGSAVGHVEQDGTVHANEYGYQPVELDAILERADPRGRS